MMKVVLNVSMQMEKFDRPMRSVNCHNNAFFTEYGVIMLVLMGQMRLLTLKAPNKNLQQMTQIFCYFYLSKKIRLDVSCEFSA